MSIQKDLMAIGENELRALIDQPVMEDKSTEYKEALSLHNDEAKRKFLAGIASFANASGGDLIYGMKASDGRPLSVQPLGGFNPDQTLLALRDLIRAHIDPKIYGIGFQPVELAGGGHALVIRVPKTWAGAHMLTYGKDNRFYTRDMNGRRLMDVPEIRAAFSLAEVTAERIRRFRMERIGDIVADETPVKLNGTARIVVHLCPLVSFESGYRCDLQSVRKSSNALRPMRANGWTPAVDFDGDFSYADSGGPENQFGYNKLFRSGCMEIVDAGGLRCRETAGEVERYFPSGVFEKWIFEAVHQAFPVLKLAATPPPLLLMLSFLDVRGYRMYVGPQYWGGVARVIARDNLILPEVLVESVDITVEQVARLMRPLFDSVWNACGWEQSLNYDEEGKWRQIR
jgi:hypothetical protein